MTVGTNYGIYGSPFATDTTNLFNQDFMYGATMPYGQGYTPSFSGISSGLQMQAQPAMDTFQKEGSGWGTGALLGLGAGGLATGGMYYLGGDNVNPFKDGKYPDSFLRTLEKENLLADKTAEKIKEIKTKILNKNGINSLEEYEMIRKISKGETLNGVTLSRTYTQDEAKAIIEKLDKRFTKINAEKIKAIVSRSATLDGAKVYLEQLRNREALLKGMKDSENLADFIKKNAKSFGLEGSEKAIEQKAKFLAQKMGGDKASALKYFREVSGGSVVGGVIKEQEGVLAGIRSSLKAEITPYLTEGGKGLVEGAPKPLQKAFNSCRLKAAGKWGIAAGIAGLVLGKILG